MTPFDLDLAKAGHPVTTIYGDKVRILCTDAQGSCPIVALLFCQNRTWSCESLERFTPEGSTMSGYPRPYLQMAGEPAATQE